MKSYVEKARTWQEFIAAMPGKHFSAVANVRLDKIVRNKDLPLEDRFDAFLLRTSWGNFSDFACDRSPKSQDPEAPEPAHEKILLKPLGQVDFARALKVDPRRIQEVVQRRQDQGLMARREDLANPGLLVPLYCPVKSRKPEKDLPRVRGAAWEEFSPRWDEEHSDLVELRKKAKSVIDPAQGELPFAGTVEELLKNVPTETLARIVLSVLDRQKLAAFKTVRKTSTSPDSPDNPSPELPGAENRNSPVGKTGTPRTPISHNARISSELRSRGGGQTLNIKKEEQQQQPPSAATASISDADVVVVADKLLIKEKAARQFLAECRRRCPECTVEDVLGAWQERAGTLREGMRNPTGLLLEAVPPTIRAYRERRIRNQPTVNPAEERKKDMATARRLLESDDPLVDDDMRRWAREVLGEEKEGSGS